MKIIFLIIMAIKEYLAKIVDIKEQAPSVRLFDLELNEEMEFVAGQFINLIFQHNGEVFMKPYSIASKPSIKNKLQLSIKLVDTGKATPHLWQKQIGDEVSVKGPFGLFRCSSANKDKLVFIGTGTGIAPLRSMIFEQLELGTQKELILVFGARHENELLFKDEMEDLEEKYPNFKYIKVLSKADDTWLGRRGHVQDNFDIIDPINSQFYLCGLPAMISEVETKLNEMGVQKEQIHKEKFA